MAKELIAPESCFTSTIKAELPFNSLDILEMTNGKDLMTAFYVPGIILSAFACVPSFSTEQTDGVCMTTISVLLTRKQRQREVRKHAQEQTTSKHNPEIQPWPSHSTACSLHHTLPPSACSLLPACPNWPLIYQATPVRREFKDKSDIISALSNTAIRLGNKRQSR